MSSEELRLFDKVRVYLDEDYSSAENFTVSMKYLNMCVLNSLLYVLNIIFKDILLCELLYIFVTLVNRNCRYYVNNQVKEDEVDGPYSTRRKRNAYRLLVGKPDGKRPLGRRRWMDNVRMDFGEVDWSGLAQDRNRWRALVNSVLNLRVP
jgi:hypothetical protein